MKLVKPKLIAVFMCSKCNHISEVFTDFMESKDGKQNQITRCPKCKAELDW
jgi:transcription elongation factor Elf1